MDQLVKNNSQDLTQAEIFNELVTEIYDSTTRPEGFNPFLTKLCQYTNSQFSIMSMMKADVGIFIGGWLHGISPEVLVAYTEGGIYKKDPIWQAVLGSLPGRFLTLRNMISWEDLQKDEGFKKWAEPIGIVDVAGGLISNEGGLLTALFVQRINDQGVFTPENLELLDSLIPHLQRAVGLYLRLLERNTSDLPLTAVLDTLQIPTIVFDQCGMVLFSNKKALDFIKKRNWLAVEKSGILSSQNKELSTKLNLALAKNFSYSFSNLGDDQSVIHADIEGEKISLCIQPLNTSAEGDVHGGALLFIHQQNRNIDESKTRLIAELFHVTPAEARVSLLLSQGMTIKAIAEFIDRKEGTVRDQIKSAFSKTGVNSQSQLVSLILTSPAFLT